MLSHSGATTGPEPTFRRAPSGTDAAALIGLLLTWYRHRGDPADDVGAGDRRRHPSRRLRKRCADRRALAILLEARRQQRVHTDRTRGDEALAAQPVERNEISVPDDCASWQIQRGDRIG